MLDLKFIRENQALVQKTLEEKSIKLDLNKLLQLDQGKLQLIQKSEDLRKQRNENAEAVQKAGGKPSTTLTQAGQKLKVEIKTLEEQLKKIETELQELLYLTPTIPSDDTPRGKDDSGNVEIRRWGEPTQFDFPLKDHLELAKQHDLIDTERGVKVSGFRGYFLKNEAATLHLALMWYVFNKMVQAGFTPMIPPTLVREMALYGTGYFPAGRGDNYEIKNVNEEETGKLSEEGLFLAGTAEVGLGAYYANETLQEANLPLKMCGFSSCFRREIGSYGRDTRGIYRVHEFMKVEQFIICQNDYAVSEKWHQKLIQLSEGILQELELPHRVIQICTGDMGTGKYKMYDIETWMPSRNNYGETHSASNLGEWQARRLNLKYQTKAGKREFVHTLNNTALASPRILIAILENNQQKDGSILIPKVLQPYLGKEKIS
ncbi:serine--tRNA ligase [Candidatus Peregrinibacteria bacterium CG08_land_8_20_14_0_20_41_10]|nr:MAG: serine--tRNA ligase [Candidatus Peregrinibacteria bacterium CG08_land_8_20_14_0_20_41_10]